ncbi:MAG: rhomboid family intramembrane serine protease [Bacteroidetes bacterium]|nr:rhomboid family intramembrane serine protease [Bacteroidota bacterium]
MIPLRDTVPSYSYPVVTVTIIVLNAFVWIFELLLGPDLAVFIAHFGIVPAKYFWLADNQPFAVVDRFLPFLTSMFLHGGWMHVIFNMWYLWIFGDNIEDRLGHARFVLFYLAAGIGAGIFHLLINSDSAVPTIGASGAIAGVMGAYFVLFPHSRVLTFIPIFFFFQIVEIPAVFFLGFWIFIQFFQGGVSLLSANSGGVAWWAHFGGFAIGALIALFFRKRKTSGYYEVLND